jgi:hypothetical protein
VRHVVKTLTANIAQGRLPFDTRLRYGSVFGATWLAKSCPAQPRARLVFARDSTALRHETKRYEANDKPIVATAGDFRATPPG